MVLCRVDNNDEAGGAEIEHAQASMRLIDEGSLNPAMEPDMQV